MPDYIIQFYNTRKETIRSHRRTDRFHLKQKVGKRKIKTAFGLLISRKYSALLCSSREKVISNMIILYPTKVSPSLKKNNCFPYFLMKLLKCMIVQDDRLNIRAQFMIDTQHQRDVMNPEKTEEEFKTKGLQQT